MSMEEHGTWKFGSGDVLFDAEVFLGTVLTIELGEPIVFKTPQLGKVLPQKNFPRDIEWCAPYLLDPHQPCD